MRKLLLNIAIVLSCFLAIGVILGVMLIVAPGVDFYDIQFIAYNSEEMNYSESFVNASETVKEVVIETTDAPVIISAEQSHTLIAAFNQNYMGFARVEKSPSFEAKLLNGVLTIKVVNYSKFLLGMNDEDYGVHIYLPMYYTGDVTVISEKSNVTYQGFNSAISDLSISTAGKVALSSDLALNNLTLSVKNYDVKIGHNVKIKGEVSFESAGADLIVLDRIEDDLKFVSKSGSLSFVECNNLTYSSESGSLVGVDAVRPKINGVADVSARGDVLLAGVEKDAKIITKNGNVSVGQLDNTYGGEYLIKTENGDIHLNGKFTSSSVSLATERGEVYVDSANVISVSNARGLTKIDEVVNLTYEGNSGKLVVESTTGASKITTKSGNVVIGEKGGGSCQNLEIVAESADVIVKNARGSVYSIKTKRGNVTFVNSDKNKNNPELTIESKSGEVNAEGLTGKTSIYTNANVYAEIEDVTARVDINSQNGDVKVLVYDHCYYSLESMKTNIETAPALGTKTKKYSTLPSDTEAENTVYVSTKWGKIAVYEY